MDAKLAAMAETTKDMGREVAGLKMELSMTRGELNMARDSIERLKGSIQERQYSWQSQVGGGRAEPRAPVSAELDLEDVPSPPPAGTTRHNMDREESIVDNERPLAEVDLLTRVRGPAVPSPDASHSSADIRPSSPTRLGITQRAMADLDASHQVSGLFTTPSFPGANDVSPSRNFADGILARLPLNSPAERAIPALIQTSARLAAEMDRMERRGQMYVFAILVCSGTSFIEITRQTLADRKSTPSRRSSLASRNREHHAHP